MQIQDYIIYDIAPLSVNKKVHDLQQLFNQLTYSHIPIINMDGVYIGCISETDALCFKKEQPIEEFLYAAEGFYVRNSNIWLDVLEAFAQNETNLMPVLDQNNTYLGYYELNDVIQFFNNTPFFAEPGSILVVEKGLLDYSFSEISQIVEANNAKLLGAFVSKVDTDLAQITLKVTHASINEIIQTFRRYSYNILSGQHEDTYLEQLKERSLYLNKYLNI